MTDFPPKKEGRKRIFFTKTKQRGWVPFRQKKKACESPARPANLPTIFSIEGKAKHANKGSNWETNQLEEEKGKTARQPSRTRQFGRKNGPQRLFPEEKVFSMEIGEGGPLHAEKKRKKKSKQKRRGRLSRRGGKKKTFLGISQRPGYFP